VTKAYIAAVLAESDAQILQQSSESLKQEARIAQTRLQAGDISKTDKNQIEIAAERFELDAHSAETTATTLRIALETLLGSTHPTGDWVAVDTLERLNNAAVPAEQTIPSEPRPDLVAAEAGLKKAEADLRMQRALRIPDPTVQLMYEHQPPDQPNTIGLGFSFPLPLWNRNKGAIRSAEASRAQSGVAIGKVKAQIASEIESTRLSYRNAAHRWRRYRDEIQSKSEEVRKTVSFAYEKGGAALLDLLTAERNDNEVRLATAQAAADTALAAAALKAALNVLEEGSEGKSATPAKP
jgi:cobalt-zinc-cadmium efflux system outer membrane protein